ncbi:unnamed protein product [Clonostachys byssicola]|uniref:Uncharacterized protein n=1 Tax=Clonostachys byssicola TaxID=160290 RepID=A0A9N9UW02_9HYPO|nr:unnamed protein product [Clonostachys byssicola]
MPGLNQIHSPVPLSPARRETKLTSGDLYASLNALASKGDRRPGSPLQEEYAVPAPPPPSPFEYDDESTLVKVTATLQ